MTRPFPTARLRPPTARPCLRIARALLATLLLAGSALPAATLPPGFVDEMLVGGFDGQVTGFDNTSPSRLFVAEQSGLVHVVFEGTRLDTPFIDLRDRVNHRVDRGLLSIAVHPQFPDRPYVYLLYTYDPPELVSQAHVGPGRPDGNGSRVARLVRYTADAARNYHVALADSETVLLGTRSTYANIADPEATADTAGPSCGPVAAPVVDCLPIDEDSHTIGAVRFAPDGMLYVTNGDGASYHGIAPFTILAQDPDSLRGKVLRIDPDTGLGLPDNPWYDGDPASNRSRVVSLGLRNPYSLAIHPQTGVPYVGDVGWDGWEEIDAGWGTNHGWPCFEGGADRTNVERPGFRELDACQAQYADPPAIEAPLISWQRGDAGAAIIGDFYTGSAFPDTYRNRLFYADFLQGWMRYANIDDPDDVQTHGFATELLPMSEIRQARDGSIYYASITTGEIRRIRYAGNGDDTGSDNADDSGNTDGTDTTDGTGTTDGTDAGSGSNDITAVRVGGAIGWAFVPLVPLCWWRRRRG